MIKIKLYFQQNFEAGFEALKMSIKATFNVSVLSKLRLTMLHIPTYKIEKIDTTHVWQHSMGRYLFDYSTDPLVHHHLLRT